MFHRTGKLVLSVITHSAILLWGVSWVGGAPPISPAPVAPVAPAAGQIHFYGEGGELLWLMRTQSTRPAVIESTESGRFLINGRLLVDRHGRLLSRLEQNARGGTAQPMAGTGCPQWGGLAGLTPAPVGAADSLSPPLLDPDGNAWMINTLIDSGNYALQVRQSIGKTGSWHPLETIADTNFHDTMPRGAIDQDGNITIVYRDVDSSYHLYAVRYEPGTGWGTPTEFFSTPQFTHGLNVATDEHGNVIAVFDPSPSFESRVDFSAYAASTGTWSAAEQLSVLDEDAILPGLAQNGDGSSVYLVYKIDTGDSVGLYAHHWNAELRTFSAPQFLPGTEDVGWSTITSAARYPISVGGDGEATVIWQTNGPVYRVYASRTLNGIWQAPHELLGASADKVNIESFTWTTSNDAGDVLAATSRWESGDTRLYAFRYVAGTGWDPASNPYTSNLPLTARVRTVFYQGARGMATILGEQGGDRQLTSLRYTGTGWLPEIVDVPETTDAYFQYMLGSDGRAVLIYEAEEVSQLGIRGTWLDHLPGDFDCNGAVGFSDLIILLGSWGPCAPAPPDCPADVDGSGMVDFNDLIALLGSWTS